MHFVHKETRVSNIYNKKNKKYFDFSQRQIKRKAKCIKDF